MFTFCCSIANPLFLFFCCALALAWRYAASSPVVIKGYELTHLDKRVIFGGSNYPTLHTTLS
jgi:hypothetical protein